jgi:hypothetical protein
MLKFNTILEANGIDPHDVQLVRHKDRGPTGVTPFSLMCNALDRFEHYQSIQGRAVFRRKLLATFVVAPAPSAETIFVNLYAIGTPQRNTAAETCPVRLKVFEPGRLWKYPLSVDERLSSFSKKLIIEWGEGYRSWVQRSDRQNKVVLEIRKHFLEPPFPQYLEFSRHMLEIPTLFPSWKVALKQSKGVYLLVDQRDGAQYVGSATGEHGFLGRWLSYAKDGHGGNVILKSRNHKDYIVTILETAGSAMDRNAILAREVFWKEKLGSRADRLGDEFGLNAN